MRKRLEDEKFWERNAPRCYLYSESDAMIGWRDVHDHAQAARRTGTPVREEIFKGSAHCAHIRENEAVYWDAVVETWKLATEQEALSNETTIDANEEGSSFQDGNLQKRAPSWTVGTQNIENSASLGRDFAASARSGASFYVTLANQPNGKSQARPWQMNWQEVDGGVASVVHSTTRMESSFGQGNEIHSYYFAAQNGVGNWYRSSEKKANAAAVGTGISAVSRDPRSMEIFYVGNNGDLRHFYSNDDGQKWVIDQFLWNGPINPTSPTSTGSTGFT
ncbi:hypothetical protein BKA61DRAFT_697900 [Leptodontidium sp. MPI-SDFR-AT-0119]|nr:hypothetical protein BKA61DRAFT_697900 [Leptodontidium sp. MPI-SDFR-AT-0119]